MTQRCEGCGEIFDEVWMMSYNTGRRTHWFCWSCWKQGQGEAAQVEIKRRREQHWFLEDELVVLSEVSSCH